MKATGIVRRIDELGRIVLPKELRRTLGIKEGDPVEVFVQGEQIVLKKYAPGCVVCGEIRGDMSNFNGRIICKPCVEVMAKHIDRLFPAVP
jgi:transcriptional pleiotropic regulator of transition state genes